MGFTLADLAFSRTARELTYFKTFICFKVLKLFKTGPAIENFGRKGDGRIEALLT